MTVISRFLINTQREAYPQLQAHAVQVLLLRSSEILEIGWKQLQSTSGITFFQFSQSFWMTESPTNVTFLIQEAELLTKPYIYIIHRIKTMPPFCLPQQTQCPNSLYSIKMHLPASSINHCFITQS